MPERVRGHLETALQAARPTAQLPLTAKNSKRSKVLTLQPILFIDQDNTLFPFIEPTGPNTWDDWKQYEIPGWMMGIKCETTRVWASYRMLVEVLDLPVRHMIISANGSLMNNVIREILRQGASNHLQPRRPFQDWEDVSRAASTVDPRRVHDPSSTGFIAKSDSIFEVATKRMAPFIFLDDESFAVGRYGERPNERIVRRLKNSIVAPSHIPVVDGYIGLTPKNLADTRAFCSALGWDIDSSPDQIEKLKDAAEVEARKTLEALGNGDFSRAGIPRVKSIRHSPVDIGL